MHKKVLITGGSGTLGKELTKHLLNNNYQVAHLSRNPIQVSDVETYHWDIYKGIIDNNCLNNVDTIVHLAGAGIADERWTEKRKKEIIYSRTQSIRLIYQLLAKKTHKVQAIISASASGYYSDRGDEIQTESSAPNTDFLAQSCIAWERAVDEGQNLNLRIVKFRTGVVLDKNDGALPKLAQPIKNFVGSPIGSGQQWISWIHVEDAALMYLKAIENHSLVGVYNMSTPDPITNEAFTKAIAKQLDKPLWAPNVPSFLLKVMLGEMSAVVLGSTRMNVDKILKAGFNFKYPKIHQALAEIYAK